AFNRSEDGLVSMCDCISYNRPQEYQKTPSVILTVPDWVNHERGTIAVDACIAEQVEALWAERIWTLSTCCGHNGEAPSHVVVHKDDAVRARDLLQEKFEHPLTVQFWVLATA